MQESDLLREVSKETGVDLKTVKLVWHTATRMILDKLLFGMDVIIRDWIKFELYTTKPRQARNPSTGEKIDVPKRYKVRMSFPRWFDDKLKEKTVY